MNSTSAFIFLISLSTVVQANTDILIQREGSEINIAEQITQQKVLKLDDAFLIQLYNRWKSMVSLDSNSHDFFQEIIDHSFESAFIKLSSVDSVKVGPLKDASEIYLLYKLGLYQSLVQKWIKLSTNNNFLNTELGLALDQVIGPKSEELLIKSGISLSTPMEEALVSIENMPSHFNNTLQAFKFLNSGKKAVKWIGRLPVTSKLRVKLAQSAILSYAKDGKLSASGTLIKNVIEPWMSNETNPEEIAQYYLTLGRLLYQAHAYNESVAYYQLIPQSSQYFLEARVESLWVYLQLRKFSQFTGELGSLKMDIFSQRFNPEIYLASAIGHTMLCQFSDARDSIHAFVKNNQFWAKKIAEEIDKENSSAIKATFKLQLMRNQRVSLQKEINYLAKINLTRNDYQLHKKIKQINSLMGKEAKRQWQNRSKLLDSAIYKLKFVRVELLSRMRAVREGLTFIHSDKVSVYQASNAKDNQIIFPSDKMPWGDEVFNMSANVMNECNKGKFYGM